MATAVGSYATWSALKTLMNKTDTTDDTLGGLICDRVNAFIEGPEGTGRVIAPVSSATYTLDGDGTNQLFFPNGLRAISLLEIAEYSGASYATETAGNYLLRPNAQDRPNGWPAMWVHLHERSTGHRWFPWGYGTVRITATTGWAAIPDDITLMALSLAERVWNDKESGLQSAEAPDEHGRFLIAKYISKMDRSILDAYSVPVAVRVVG